MLTYKTLHKVLHYLTQFIYNRIYVYIFFIGIIDIQIVDYYLETEKFW